MELCARALRGLPAVLLLLPSLTAQRPEKPRFDKYHIVPYGSFLPGMLTTGEFASIFGWHLTPKRWCGATHTQQPPYPFTLCGVQVIVGGHPAGLLYAGPTGNKAFNLDQINFQVPTNVKAEGEVPIQVCVGAMCSDALNVPFTNQDILLRVEEKAYVRMPLWVDFTIPFNNEFRYPASPCPWDFGGFQIEVRKGGHILPSRPMPKCTEVNRVAASSAISLSKGVSRRLPVHLFYAFDAPGEYEIRMSGPLLTPDLRKVARRGHSDWIGVKVEPFSDRERQAWLNALTRAVPSRSPQRYEGELIVSLLAQSDEKALKALLNFLPAPPPPAGPAPISRVPTGDLPWNWARDCLAPEALNAFSDFLLERLIPPARLVSLRKTPAYCDWQ